MQEEDMHLLHVLKMCFIKYLSILIFTNIVHELYQFLWLNTKLFSIIIQTNCLTRGGSDVGNTEFGERFCIDRV